VTDTSHYVRHEETDERTEAANLSAAMEMAKVLRAAGCRRLMVCIPSGRIVGAWDDGERTI